MMCSLDHMLLVKDLVEIQHRQYLQNQEYMDRYLLEEWADMEHELLRERGLWGPIVGSRLDKWMLDMTEGMYSKSTSTQTPSRKISFIER